MSPQNMFSDITFMLLFQTLFALGFLIMILGTYANLFATEQAMSKKDVSPVINVPNPKPVDKIAADINLPLQPEKPDIKGNFFIGIGTSSYFHTIFICLVSPSHVCTIELFTQ